MIYSNEVNEMCCVKQGVQHGAAPIPEEAKWVKAKEISDISGLTHGVGWCAPQQGACKLTLNVKEGVIQADHRMFRYDPFRCYGSRSSAGQNHSGGTEYRPRLRCDQYCNA